MSNGQGSSRTEEERRFKFVVLESFLKGLVKMVDKEKLKSLLRGFRSEPDLLKVKEKPTDPIAMLKEEHETILKNLDDLERVLEQAINIIRRTRRIRTTRSRQLHYSPRREIPPKEGQMPEIVERR